MKLGISLGYADQADLAAADSLVAQAQELGYESIWSAEAYGADALTPLGWHAARTRDLRLGTGIVQMSARTPTATAMAAMTLDHLSGGRMVLGLGVSGPQVVEGWYGQPYARPLERTREYIGIVRSVMARQVTVAEGRHYTLPYRPGTGLGKPLRSSLRPLRPTIPILLGAEGPLNVALAAEIADGWIPAFYSPYDDLVHRASLQEGFARRGGAPDDFEIASLVSVEFGELEQAADRVRPLLALYIGGMGAKGANFHYNAFARLGFEDECRRIQSAYLDGHHAEAIAAVSTAMVEKVALVGPPEKVADELAAWRESLVTTLIVVNGRDKLQTLAKIAN
ncbi:LLM class F420-dependent oxidoreductase [Dactylosporangium sp. NPDC000555]|uniref:LLM class F420-dependent oxidoreductase n=1 Tax=Dactylosporangium sp. NPDC000555 TaxID=3154260 RepID=UPI003317807E